ncbi:MAG: methionyl-tRNA formyltransferase [Clostridia bacterium]|nr:methionyl-tRNA formyltransferase [Clostridia bacterium]
MGTPEFAVPSLRALIDGGYEVVGAFTQPDRPAGRGNRLTACPVKLLALEKGVPVYQFEKIRRREGREALEALRPDLVVTAAFGQILSQRILDIPPLGTLNVHASLLPAYRGAAPINWCIALGEKKAGVTTMFTDAGIDTGDMALSVETDIGPLETAGELTLRLSEMGAKLLIETIRRIEAGDCPRVKQDESRMSHQPMLSREDGLIDWTMSAEAIACRVRGFNPWPGTFTYLPDGGVMKLWLARAAEGEKGGRPGEVIEASAKKGLFIACGEGTLEVLEMQAPGSKKMNAKAYLMGKPMPVGTIFSGERK